MPARLAIGLPEIAIPDSGSMKSNGGTYQVEYTLEPAPIPLNEVFGISVRIFVAADRTNPLGDIELAVDGRMPDHRHGMNRVSRVERRQRIVSGRPPRDANGGE